jgi:tetratricopeptide (TPR) repeat protein
LTGGFNRVKARGVSANSYTGALTKAALGTEPVAAALLTLAALTILLTGSRGGAIALAAAGSTFCLLLYRAGQLQGRRLGMIAGGGLAVFLAFSMTDYEGVSRRLTTLTSASLDEIDEHGARRKIWAANVEAIKSGGWFGAGAGSHRDVYPVYLDDPPAKEYTHADNGYLQVVTENGIVGGLLLAAALACCGVWCFRALNRADSPSSFVCASACAAGLTASVVHSAFDFVWYIPGCLSITLVLAACVMRLGELSACSALQTARTRPLRRSGAANLAVTVSLLAAFSVTELFCPAVGSFHWDAFQRAANAQREFASQLLIMSPDAAAAARDEEHAAHIAALETMIRELEQAVAWRPAFAAAHRQLANRYLELYHLRAERSDNPMPAPQVREAAIASQFRSAAELESWLHVAFGENGRLLYPALAHARIAARLSPLQGAPYVRLAALGFLQGRGYAATDAYLRQALIVRPYDGDLLFEVGADLCVRNSVETGLDCWARALRIRGEHRVRVARAVAGSMAFANLIELFQPKWDTLPEFWKAYRLADETNVAAFLDYAAAQTKREVAAANPEWAAVLWRRLAQVELEAGRDQACIASLHVSYNACPDDYSTRRMLAVALVDAGRPDEAAPHLQWCLDREPNDARVAEVLMKITSDRLAARPPASSEPR